ncbi:hypothetical protein ACFY4I_12790 [Streptomyces scabiei]|uniref:hypothetical protein n=1 Tax=Streptomyces scabiei TaxID=1930 RepID=UPI003695650F
MSTLIDTGALRPVVDSVHPLTETASATGTTPVSSARADSPSGSPPARCPSGRRP